MRAPDMPYGWPIEMAPPETFSLSFGMPSLSRHVEHLARERLVQLPQVDIVHLEAMLLQQFRHREHRADAHLVRIAACDHHAAIRAQRLEVALLGFLRFHQHERRGAVR